LREPPLEYVPDGGQAVPPEELVLGQAGSNAASILIMAAFYPACRWFADIGESRISETLDDILVNYG
jgi:hypothetical protein